MDATVQDSTAAMYFLQETPELKAAGEPRKPGFYVIYYRKNDPKDPDLGRQIDQAILDGLKDGTLRRIYRKYGLWNGDQEWMTYNQTGSWPPDEETQSGLGETTGKGNPWP